jgi:hypothetical protein
VGHPLDLALVVATGIKLAGGLLSARVLGQRGGRAEEGKNGEQSGELHGGSAFGWIFLVRR